MVSARPTLCRSSLLTVEGDHAAASSAERNLEEQNRLLQVPGSSNNGAGSRGADGSAGSSSAGGSSSSCCDSDSDECSGGGGASCPGGSKIGSCGCSGGACKRGCWMRFVDSWVFPQFVLLIGQVRSQLPARLIFRSQVCLAVVAARILLRSRSQQHATSGGLQAHTYQSKFSARVSAREPGRHDFMLL